MIISRDVSWMCPSSLIENVPSKWNKIKIALYHVYFEGSEWDLFGWTLFHPAVCACWIATVEKELGFWRIWRDL